MLKYILLMIAVFVAALGLTALTGCEDSSDDPSYKYPAKHDVLRKSVGLEQYYTVATIDSCEYIIFNNYHDHEFHVIHKANCKNPIHKRGTDVTTR